MQSLQKRLSESCEDAGDGASFRNDYSGRGMYGRSCVGITGTITECQAILAQVIKDMSMALSARAMESVDPNYSATEDDLADTENEFDIQIDQLMDFSQDSMGMGGVIWYWPELEPLSEEELEDDGQPSEDQEWHDFDPAC